MMMIWFDTVHDTRIARKYNSEPDPSDLFSQNHPFKLFLSLTSSPSALSLAASTKTLSSRLSAVPRL
jgi:hypothetical protein